MATLFAPQVRAVQPAFIYNKQGQEQIGEVKIYFSLSAYNSDDDFTDIRYSIIDPNQASTWGTNSMITGQDSNDNAYIEVSKPSDIDENTKEYILTINLLDNTFKTFTKNQFYQVQLWLVNNNKAIISEPSQVTLIRPIAAPRVEIEGDGEETYSLTELKGSLSSATPNELLDTCYCVIGDVESNRVKTNGQNFIIPLDPLQIQEGYSYSGTLYYTTIHGYNGSQVFSIKYNAPTAESAHTVTVTRSSATGSFFIQTTHSGKLERYGDTIGEEYWQIIADIDTAKGYEDFTIKSDVNYKYRVTYNERANCTKELDDFVQVQFEDIFLSDKDTMFVVRYNPNISGFKYVVQESITNTLGGKYPIVRSNGDTKYRQFNISGLIYCNTLTALTSAEKENSNLMDDVLAWLENDESTTLYLTSKNKLTNNEVTQNVAEKLARQKVMEFLTNKKPKLFRSFEEGNIIVYLSNISFTPNKTLGRHIYDFSATATELCEYNDQNLAKYELNLGGYHPASQGTKIIENNYYEIVRDYTGAVTIR